MTTNRHNIPHKRQQYILNQLKKIIKNNNSTIVKADKTKAIVIISKEILKDKVNNFIIESPLASLHKKQRTQMQDMLPQQY